MIKVPLGIFWDIENCPNLNILRKKSNGIARAIRLFIEARHPECLFPIEFCCAWDTRNKEDISKRLSNNGVDVLYANATSKNAADEKLKEEIDKFVHQYSSTNATIVIITGDINFKRSIQVALQKGLDVIIIYGDNASQALLSLVKESYNFDEILNTTADEGSIDDTFQTVTLKVMGWPLNVKLELVQKRLSMLSLNCGGKIAEINENFALINYSCMDDAHRSLKRIQGMDAFGNELQVKVHAVNNNTNKGLNNDCNTNKYDNHNNNNSTNNNNDNNSNELIDTYYGSNADKTKSVIVGLYTRRDESVQQLTRNIVKNWGKDSDCEPDMIEVVFRNKKFAGKDGKAELFVTAVSEQANNKIIGAAQTYFNDYSKNLFWRSFSYSNGGYNNTNNNHYNHSYFDVNRYSSSSQSNENNTNSSVNHYETNSNNNNNHQHYDNSSSQHESNANNFYNGKYILTVPANHPNKKSKPYLQQFNDGCKSVVKGLDTRHDENVLHYVRKIVKQWRIDPDVILDVTRSKKFTGKNGKATLFVITTNEEWSKKIVNCARMRFNNADKNVFWQTFAQHNTDKTSDKTNDTISANKSSESNGNNNSNNTSNTSVQSLETFEEIRKEDDSNLPPSSPSSSSVDSHMAADNSNKTATEIYPKEKLLKKLNEIRLDIKRFASTLYDLSPNKTELKKLYDSLLSDKDQFISNYFGVYNSSEMDKELYAINEGLCTLFVYYENHFGNSVNKAENSGPKPYSTNSSRSKTNEQDLCKTVISGVWSDHDDNVLKLVQEEVDRWDDDRICGDDISDVGRDAKFKYCNGKVLLFVTSKNKQKNDILLDLADKHFNNAEKGVIWKARMVKRNKFTK